MDLNRIMWIVMNFLMTILLINISIFKFSLSHSDHIRWWKSCGDFRQLGDIGGVGVVE